MYETIELKIEDNVATIKMNRPDILNPLDIKGGMEITNAIDSVSESENIRVLVIKGSSKAFSAGGDIKAMMKSIEDETPGEFMDELTSVLYGIGLKLRKMRIPVVSVVMGHAVGAGMNLALCSDFIIASENAIFAQSFSKLALIPGFGGTFLLSRQLPWQKACEIAFFGDPIDATEMKRLGFVNEVVPAEEIDNFSDIFVKKLSKGPTLTFGRTKELFLNAMDASLNGHMEYERKVQIQSARSEDYSEGVRSLNEKKKADFIGK